MQFILEFCSSGLQAKAYGFETAQVNRHSFEPFCNERDQPQTTARGAA